MRAHFWKTACVLALVNLSASVAFAADEAQHIEKSLEYSRDERNLALAQMRDRGEVPSNAPAAGADAQGDGLAECDSYEKKDAQVAPLAAAKAPSGAAFLEAEAQASEMISLARKRLNAVNETKPQDASPLIAELMHRRDLDQAARMAWADPPSTGKPLSAVARYIFNADWVATVCPLDHANTRWMKQQIASIGWFDRRKFGSKADAAAWLLVQHADDDPEFQEQVIAILASLVKEGGTSQANYAYLYDRVAVNRGRPQLYGTQGRCVGKEWQPGPIENPEELESRRKQLGLNSEEEYKKEFTSCAQ